MADFPLSTEQCNVKVLMPFLPVKALSFPDVCAHDHVLKSFVNLTSYTLWEFFKIYKLGVVGNKNERIRFQG